MTELPTVLEYTTVHVTVQDLIENATTDTKGRISYTPLISTIPGIDGKVHQVDAVRDYLVDGSSSVQLLTGIPWRATFHLQGNIEAPDPVEFTTDGTTINLAYQVTAASSPLVETRTVVVAGVATADDVTAEAAARAAADATLTTAAADAQADATQALADAAAAQTTADAAQVAADLEADVAAKVGTAGALDASLDARYGANARPRAADGIFAAVDQALVDGRSCAIQVQGDSTGNATDEWVYGLAGWIAARRATAHVKYKVWDDATQDYAAWVDVQAGTGERYANFPANSRSFYMPYTNVTTITGDIDVRVRVALDDWTPATSNTLIARYGSSGNRAWRLYINTAGYIVFAWTTNGSTEVSLNTTSAPGFTDGQPYWVRATLDVDNGGGGYTITLYTSTDGVTWTTQRQSITSSGTTSIFDPSTQEYELGGRGLTGEIMSGKVYEAQIRQGIGGKIVNPQPIEAWLPRALSGGYVAGTFGGAETVYIVNGSHSGASYTYLSDATRHPKMVHPYAGCLNLVSCAHNDGDGVDATYLSARDAWQALTDARTPGSQTALVTQNPEISPVAVDLIHRHARRRQLLMGWAARKGLAIIDTYRAFEETGDVASYLNTDGIHPTQGFTAGKGMKLWLDTVTGAYNNAA